MTLATGDLAWTASPARQLHDRLLESFSYPAAAAAEKTLSRRQRLAILVGATAFLWSLIGATAAAIAIR
ncbi:hypothetical protein F9288_07160 [Sphingomonas sp. CL5.1]|uniref:hypothetical protein n=1 Tax=Sphingomonas sp. CL5.1 TaxID=2653203 RepID=UPI00158367CA|nr:hypothetical protein [Sphingomonas sp. CL5.1]QKR99447.1 hypothetical protein F9288_07160 [Sphingomonas sp. CL5.1]